MNKTICFVASLLCAFGLTLVSTGQDLNKPEDSIRVATYNVALNRKKAGQLTEELESGKSKDAKALAKVLQLVRPDVVLLNEVDYDGGKSAKAFVEKYLAVGQDGNCLLYTSPSPRDRQKSRMPSSA